MKLMTEDTVTPWIVSQNWAVVQGQVFERGAFAQEYFLVWIADDAPDVHFIRAAHLLNGKRYKDLFPGYSIRFHETPSAGFVLKAKRHWNFQSPEQAGVLLDRVIWEVNRLARA